jgi:hypothetical protein
MALYEKLTASSSPEEIAAAYREFTGLVGGDTQDAQTRAVDYLTGLGISAPTITQAYDQFLNPVAAPLSMQSIANTSGLGSTGIGVSGASLPTTIDTGAGGTQGALSQATSNASTGANNVLSGIILGGDSFLSGDKASGDIAAQTGQVVTNTAIGGQTSSDVLNQLNTFTENGGTFAPGSTVILNVGGNDLLGGIDPATVQGNINSIVSRLGALGVNVVLSGASDVGSVADVTGSTNLVMSDIYNNVANSNRNVTLVDSMSGLLNQKNLVDDTGFHLTAPGQAAFNTSLSNAYLQSIGAAPISFSDQNILDFARDNNLTADQAMAIAPSFGVDPERVQQLLAASTATAGTASQAANQTWNYGEYLSDLKTGVSDVDELKSLLNPLATQDATLAGNAQSIFDEILAQQEAGTAEMWSTGNLGTRQAAALDTALRLAESGVSSLADIGVRKVEKLMSGGEGPDYLAVEDEYYNKTTGEKLQDWDRLSQGVNSGTKLNYRLGFTDDGVAVPYTTGRQSGWVDFREGTLKPVVSTFGAFIPGAAPFIAAGNAINAANKGDWGTALVSAMGAVPGFNSALNFSPETLSTLNTAKTAGQVLNAIDKGNPVALANALMQTDTGKTILNSDMGNGITMGDVVNTAKITKLAIDGNYAEALSTAGQLTNSPNLAIAASAVNFGEAVKSGDPFRVLNAVGQLDGAVRASDAKTQTGDLGNRVYDDTIVQAGADAFLRAKQVGASDEDALAAADAITGVQINPIDAGGPNLSTTTTYDQRANTVDTNFGDLQGAIETNAMNDAVRADKLNLISQTPRFNDAYRQARELLGPNQTFTWNGKQYSTATAEERPDLSVPSIEALNARNLATVTDASRTVAAQTDTAARDTAAADAARLADTKVESTGFFKNLYNDLNSRLKLQGEGAVEYLKNNPNSPITQSVSTAFEAAGELQRNLGGVALALDNKPVADAMISGGSKLQKLGQSIGTGPQDTKNWNDTLNLINKADGILEKGAVIAGRIMDGTSGLGRQVAVELRQELPALFLGGGSLKGVLIAGGLVDTADTGGAAVIDAYDDVIKNGGTHAQGLSAGRKAGAAAAATEAVIQATLGKIADFGAGKLDNLISKGTAKVAGEGVVEGSQEAGASAAVDLALGNAIDVNKALTQGIVGAAVGKGTATATSGVDAAQTESINNSISTAVASGNPAAVNSAITGGIKTAADSGADVDLSIASTVSTAVDAGADVNSVVAAATKAANSTGNDVLITSDDNVVTINNATTNTNTTVDVAAGLTTSVNNNTGVTTVVDAKTNTTTAMDASTVTQTKVDGNTQTTVVADSNTNTKTQTVVDTKTNTTTSTTVDTNNNTTTQTTIAGDTQTTVLTDVNNNTQTTVTLNVNTGEVIEVKEAEIPGDWKQPEIKAPDVKPPTVTTPPTAVAEETGDKASKSKPQKQDGRAVGIGGAGLPLGIGVDPASLRSKVTEGAIDPLARVKAAQAELERDVMMNQMDPRFLAVIQQRMNPQQQTGQIDSDVGALERLLRGESDMPSNEGRYYSYGAEDSIDDILGGKAANYKEGGFVEPLKASGGSMALPLLVKSGGALGHYKGRENFKEGKHVAGEGDGQSDDIPAWLADSEFVLPADVVAALGNGSTKAGTDKLYEMMYSIRERARSTGPKDLPPPALKSPLDYLKKSNKK